ncbi:MAG TPA: dipeptidase [Blastocatellia bacterium]|jgi:membrane dipeptidase|nr:dipeptidase [Blastocatellia bacterium]
MLNRFAKLSALFCLAAVTVPGLAHEPSSAPGGGRRTAMQDSTVKDAGARPARDEAALRARAERLHREAIVVDTHNDVTSAILDGGFDLGMAGDAADRKEKTHTDIRRMKEGGLDAEFFAVYVGREFVGKPPAEGGGAARRALDMIGVVYEQARRHPETFEMAYTSDDIRRIARKKKIAALMGIEGGHAIEDSLHALRMFHRLGIRYMTLTHSNTNNWADSEGDINNPDVKHHNGLTDFGREVVREMNRIGMMVDISHVSDKTFYDAIETTRAPVIASHSSARALAPHTRNMTDDMLKAVAKNGGVVMVNFYDGFIDKPKAELGMQGRVKQEELRKQYPNDSKRVAEEMQKWRAGFKQGKTPLSVLIDHFDHVARVAGIDHVGIGSDFDGVPSLPEGMEDISRLPVITLELMRRGYSDGDIKKVLGENILRVMSAVERVASEMQSAGADASSAKK